MGILDDVLVNAKSAVDVVSKSAVDLYDASKLKLSEAKLKSELNRKFQCYGKAVYRKADEKIIKRLEQEIADLLENFNFVSSTYKKVKDKDLCKICGTPLEKEEVYCHNCGSKIAND